MKTTITNKIIVENYSMDLLNYCEDHLVIANPDFHIAQKMGRYTKNIPPNLTLYERKGWDLHIPFGELGKIWQYIKDAPYELKFAPFYELSMKGDITLYPYQENAILALKNAKNGILEAPCGSGKTQMGIALIQALGQKALWLTHTKDLLTQSMQRAKDYFEGDFGTITDGKVNIGQDITFATVQTMTKLDLTQYQDEWNVVIVDECHRVAGTPTKVMQFYKVLSHLKARHKFGLSATLERVDGLLKSTFALLGDIVYKIEQEEVGDKIIKAKHEIVATDLPESELYLETDGTFNYMKLIDYIVSHDDRNALIASNIAKFPFSHHLVLSHRVEHLNALKSKLDSLGLKSYMVYGSLSKDKREDIFNQMRDGEANVLLATYQLAKEGLDIPILDKLHLATPNKNKAIVKQSAGRIERNIEGKDHPIVYDYVDVQISYCMGMYKKRKAILK